MADVFLSYAQEDRTRARQLADALRERGWDVWWDAHVYVGTRFRAEISRQLQSAKCVVVLWSQTSIESDWVIDEAQDGKNRGVLVQALIDDVPPPHGFRGIQWANLNSWSGDTHAEEFVKLADGISRFAPVATPTPAATPRALQPDLPAHTVIDSDVQPSEPEGWVRWLRLASDSLAELANRRPVVVGGAGLASVIVAIIALSSPPPEQAPQVAQVASPTPTVSSPSSASPATDATLGQNGGNSPTPSTDRLPGGEGPSSAPPSPATTPANEVSKPSESDRSRSSSPTRFGDSRGVANPFSANTTATPTAKPSPPASNNSTGAQRKADCPSWRDTNFSTVDFDSDSLALSDSERATVERVATLWKKNEGSFVDVTVYERRASTTRTISAEDMASSVMVHFILLGIPYERIRVHSKTLPPECLFYIWARESKEARTQGRVTFGITTSDGIRVAPSP